MADPSKTEEATPKRRNKARREGNVPKSQEIAKAMSVLAGFLGLLFWIRYMGKRMLELFQYFLSNSASFVVTDGNVTALMFWIAEELAKILLPVLLFIGVVMFLTIRMQVGKLWTTKVFAFKWSKFSLMKGLKRMFASADTFVRLGKSILLALVIGVAPLIVIRKEISNVLTLYHADAAGIAVYILSLAASMVKYALIPMVVIGLMDLFYTRWSYKENLKMSKDEIKDERKQAEGDEKVKAKMRQRMMQMSMRRMMQNVPKADVIITNPTHIAVALSYDQEVAPAPMVVAMGADLVAEKIKEIAREHRIPIREDVALARALYKQTEVGDTIPAELFQAVAILLAKLWKNKPPKRKKKK